MRNRTIVFILIIVATLIFVSCQATPENNIVVQKDTERMVEKAAEEEHGTKLSDVMAPDTNYVFSKTGAEGKLQIRVDAPVHIPDADKISISEVKDCGFSQEMISGIFNYLFPDEKPMSIIQHTTTKEEIQELLLMYKKAQADGSYDKEFYSEEDWQRKIDETQAWYESAPETSNDGEPTAADGTMTRIDDGKSVYYELLCQNPDTRTNYFFVRTYEEINANLTFDDTSGMTSQLCYRKPVDINYSMNGAIQTDGSSVPSEAAGNLTIEYDAAKKLCDGFLNAAGKAGEYEVGNVAYMPNESGKYALDFIYRRTIDGIPTILIDSDAFGTADGFAMPWGYEYIHFIVDGTGIAEVEWKNPVEIGEVVQENVGVMTFEEVKPIFENMIKTIYEPQVDFGGTAVDPNKIDVDVENISLEYIRIREQNESGKIGLLVPAWLFYGHSTRTTTIDSEDYYSYDEILGVGGEDIKKAPIAVLAINAIDGSVIDLGKGY